MSKCHYHPESRSSAKCPSCSEMICDRCRMNGTSQRCMTCHSAHAKGGDGKGPAKEMCQNHAGVPATEKCARCRKAHCPACLNGAKKCFRCALLPAPGEGGPGRGTGALKARGTGKHKPPKASPLDKPGVKAGLGGFAAVCVLAGVWVGGGADFYGLRKRPQPPYTGPARVAILSPRAGATLTSTAVIKLDVGSPAHIQKVEVTVDGKYWQRFTAAPFQTDWETQIFKNGAHVIEAKATYRGGKKVAFSKVRVKTRNRGG